MYVSNLKVWGVQRLEGLAGMICFSPGKGHFSRSVDNQPRNSIFIPVPNDFVAQDC